MAYKIIDQTKTERTEAATILQYFGRKENQPLAEFYSEVKALSPESKTELAIGAAKELGWGVVEG